MYVLLIDSLRPNYIGKVIVFNKILTIRASRKPEAAILPGEERVVLPVCQINQLLPRCSEGIVK